MVESRINVCVAQFIMFYKLIYQESDKRKKIDETTKTFEGLRAFAQKVFKLGGSDVGFLFLGGDDVSAYEITCDEDLEYVLEVSEMTATGSKFITIKVIENFESSPENPDKFSRVDASEEDKRENESFENLSSAISRVRVQENPEDLREDLAKFDSEIIQRNEEAKELKEMIESNSKEDLREDLAKFDSEIIRKNEEEREQKEMIESIDKMIEQNEDLKDFGKEIVKEEVPNMEALNEEMKKVELEEQKPEEVEPEPEPVENPVLLDVDEVKEPKKILDEQNIRELASHLSESMMVENGSDKKAELESKIGDILNATLSQINQKFENKKKKMEKKKNKQKTKKYFQYCKKVKKKMWKFNGKMKKLFSDIEDKKDVPFDTIIWSNQKEGFNSMETENLKMELSSLAEVNRLQAQEIEKLAVQCREAENIIASLQQGKPVDYTALAKRPSMSVETMHLNIVCDGCQTANFKGRRYKCVVCPDFDLCEDCEGKKIHSHPMLRLTTNDINSRKLNWALKFLRERPRFQRLFNLPMENSDSSDNEDKKKCRRRRWWWMKKMFGGPKNWKKNCHKRSKSSSSSSSSDESKSPEKGNQHPHKHRRHPGHHHRRRWRKFAKHMQKKGMKWMDKIGFPKHGHPMFKPWFIDFSKQNEMNNELKDCARPFPGFMCGDFKKKKAPGCQKKVKHDVCPAQKEKVRQEVVQKLENKTAEQLIPADIKKSLEGMGVEIVDCYIEPKNQNKIKPELGPNDIKIEVDIVPPAPTKKPENDLMSEDKLIRKSSKPVEKKPEKVEEGEVEDFKIECETPKKAMSSEEIEIDQRKEYVRVMLNNNSINEEILHFFVVNNLDLSKEEFYRLMEEQKKFLSQC